MPLISQDALVHPDHPLHLPGEDGITLFLGGSLLFHDGCVDETPRRHLGLWCLGSEARY